MQDLVTSGPRYGNDIMASNTSLFRIKLHVLFLPRFGAPITCAVLYRLKIHHRRITISPPLIMSGSS